MRKLTAIITALALMLCFGAVQAQSMALDRNMNLDFRLGGTFNATDGTRGDLYPSAFTFGGDLTYMLNPNLGIVPVSIQWDVYSFDDDLEPTVNQLIPDVPATLPGDPDTWPTAGDAFGFAYTPGLYFTTSSDRPVDFFGQVGAGLYHYNEDLEILQNEENYESTDFSLYLSGGLDYVVSDLVALTGQARYMWVDTDQSRDQLVGFTGGLKLMF